MKILFISQYFYPEPCFLNLSFIKEFIKMGHTVEVLTGFPCYPQGKLYDGYKQKIYKKEVIDGVTVIRLPLYPSHNRSAFKRMLYYISLMFSMLFIGPWLLKKADVAYVHQGPATLAIPATFFKYLKRISYVYNIQDMWPDAVANFGCNRVVVWLTNKLSRIPYRTSAKIITQSPGFKEELIKRNVKPEKIDVVYNWCDETQIKTAIYDIILAEKMRMKGKFNILHAGAMGEVQGLDSVIEAAKYIKDKNADIQFVLIGDGIARKSLEKKVADLNLKNVIFHDRVPFSEIGKIMALADVMFVHLTDTFLHSIAIPSKVQAYLAVGKPILAAIRGDAADLVIKAQAGLKCEPENPQAIAEATLKFYDLPKERMQQMGQNASNFYKSQLSEKIAAQKYMQVFEKLVKKS